MFRIRRILGAPFRLLYWLNYGNDGVYWSRSKKRTDGSQVRTRPFTHAELDRTTRQIENTSNSGPRYGRGMWWR